MKPVLALVALAGTATLVAACSGGGAGPDGVSAGRVSPVVSAPPVNSGAIGVSPPVTVAEVRAAGGVYRLPLPFPSVAATPYGVYVSWDVTSYGRATSDVLARIDPPSGTITASVLTDGFGQAVAAGGSLWVTTGSEVLRLNPVTLAVISRVRLGQPGPGPGSLAVAGGALWLAEGSQLIRVSLRTGAIIKVVRLPHTDRSDVGSDAAGTVLVVSTAYGGSDVRIERRDPVTGALIRSTPPTSAVTAPGIGGVIGSEVWYSVSGGMGGGVGRLNVVTLTQEPFSLHWNATNAIRVWVANGLVWVTQAAGGPRLNFCAAPGTGHVLASLPLGGADSGIVRAIGSQYLYYLPNTANPLLSRVRIPAPCRGSWYRGARSPGPSSAR
ncbi:MAG TPA: hypothetical protein VKU77_32885 [Streptosporangiaceae bacterium]|nr:hypothetical protein [Streptosporangiaceae bacterium]